MITMIRHHRITCDGELCHEGFEISGFEETKMTIEDSLRDIHWKTKGKKNYCPKCVELGEEEK